MNKNKIVIIGSGPAATSAALYLGMSGEKDIILFAGHEIGGQLTTTSIVENYLGFESISGPDLADKFMDQSRKYVSFKYEFVTEIARNIEGFNVITDKNTYECHKIIIASGSSPTKLDIAVPFENKGVSYCHICDGFLFQNKDVVVVGGGNSAFEAVMYLSNICKTVHLVHRRDQFRAFEEIQQKVFKLKNVIIHKSTEISSIYGGDSVTGVQLSNQTNIDLDGIFVHIGHKPNTSFIDFIDKDNTNYILVDRKNQTSNNHIFAVGDCCVYNDNIPKFLQAIVAAAEGCNAALHMIKTIN